MKQNLKLLGAFAVIAGLTACAAPRSPDQLSQVTIDYRCGPGGQDPLTVQYTFQGSQAQSARVIYQGQVVMLPRSTVGNADMVGNTFRSNNYTWLTQTFDIDTVGEARGEMLTVDLVPDDARPATPSDPRVPVTPEDEVSNIVVSDCTPVVTARS